MRHGRRQPILGVILASIVGACAASPPSPAPATPAAVPPIEPGSVGRWVPEVVGRLDHDDGAWTQGLVVVDGRIYESTGRYGESSIRELDRETGRLLRDVALPADLYGEGLAAAGDELLQLTWREGTLIAWERSSLEEADRLRYDGEGWGLCHDGDRLVMSDGSPTLTLRKTGSFEMVGTLVVTLDGVPHGGLNELECIGSLVFANVWPTSEIAVIDMTTGAIGAIVDASPLEDELGAAARADVLNGIAYDASTRTFLLTGKLWPVTFEVRFVPGA